MVKTFLVMVIISIITPIHLSAQVPLRYDALLFKSTYSRNEMNGFINNDSYSIDPITLGTRQKEKGKIFLKIASSLAAGGILMLGVGALVPPDPSYSIDLQSMLLAGGTVVIGAAIGLSIPGINLWYKGKRTIRKYNLSH